MNTHVTLVEGGPAQPFTGTDADLAELRMRSAELVSRLSLPTEPFEINDAARTVAVNHVAGFIPLGDSTIEVIPHVLRHDPGWRLSMLTMLTKIHHLEWEPVVDRASRHANMPALLGLIVAEAMGRAAGEGVPRTYVESTGTRQSIRGQLDPAKAWRRVVDPYLVDCRFSDFVANHPVASALKWACGELSGAVSDEWLQAELRAYTDLFPDADNDLPAQAILESMQLSPQYGFLNNALDVSRLMSVTPQGGTSARPGAPARAFLWSTSEMFTEFAHFVIAQSARALGASSHREQVLAPARSVRLRERAVADVVVDAGAEVVAMKICADDYSEDQFDEVAGSIVQAGGRLGSTDVAVMFPATMQLRPGTQWRLRDADGPNMLHAFMLDPSGVGERGGFDRLMQDIQMDLGSVVTVSRRRTSRAVTPRFA